VWWRRSDKCDATKGGGAGGLLCCLIRIAGCFLAFTWGNSERVHVVGARSFDVFGGHCHVPGLRLRAPEALRHDGVVHDGLEGEPAPGQAHDVEAGNAPGEHQLRVALVEVLSVIRGRDDLPERGEVFRGDVLRFQLAGAVGGSHR